MKKLFILSLATLGFVACENRPEHVILSGKIANYSGGTIQIIGNEDFKKDLKIKEDGSFLDTLTLKTNYYTFLDQSIGLQVPLFLKEGDELNINIDISNPAEYVKFSGKDTIANVYLFKKSTLTRELQQTFMQSLQQGGNLEGFKKALGEINQKYTDLIKNYKDLPSDFVKSEEKNNKFTELQLKFLYPRILSNFSNGEKVEMPKEFADELAKIDFDNASDFEKFPQYRDLLAQNFFSKIDPMNPDWKALANQIRNLKSENIKAFLAKAFVDGLSPENSADENQEILKVVKDFVKDEALVKQVEERVKTFEKFNIQPGATAPTFDFENFAGGKTSLESLKGKLVYIDVWATWCTPCLQEIPALQALEKEYHGKNIAFVSISIDQEKQKWTDYLKQNKLSGIQLYGDLSVDNNFADAYNIQSIPRFILIDKEGKIINANAPRPSSNDIKDLINKHL